MRRNALPAEVRRQVFYRQCVYVAELADVICDEHEAAGLGLASDQDVVGADGYCLHRERCADFAWGEGVALVEVDDRRQADRPNGALECPTAALSLTVAWTLSVGGVVRGDETGEVPRPSLSSLEDRAARKSDALWLPRTIPVLCRSYRRPPAFAVNPLRGKTRQKFLQNPISVCSPLAENRIFQNFPPS